MGYAPPAVDSNTTRNMECFRCDDVVFTISGYLPGEYALRVLPLICKGASRSRRLSLSLLGSSTTTSKSPVEYDVEGPIYGIYSIARDFQKLVNLGHSFNALKLKGSEMVTMVKCTERTFSNVKTLHLSSSPLELFPFSRFPSLTKLSLDRVDDSVLTTIWDLPLTSLTLLAVRTNTTAFFPRPPAFAQTLRSLYTNSPAVLDILSPYCHSLQDFRGEYHKILKSNHQLTSLTLSDNSRSKIELTPFTHLVEFKVNGFVTHIHSANEMKNLISVVLSGVDMPASSFLRQCPALKRASLEGRSWADIVKMTSVLDPKVCTHLTLNVPSPPSFYEVNQLLEKGFHVNEDFLLRISDPKKNWKKLVAVAPHIKNLRVLTTPMEKFLTPPSSFLPLFHRLSVINLKLKYSELESDVLLAIVKACLVLRELCLVAPHGGFANEIEVDSQSLRKLDLTWDYGPPRWKLNLPNVTHCTLKTTEGGEFFAGLLDGDPQIILPRLRVLTVDFNACPPIGCKVGHSALTKLEIQTKNFLAIDMVLRNLPSLRALTSTSYLVSRSLEVDVPGNCDISLRNYSRKSCSERENFHAILHFSGVTSSWKVCVKSQESKERKQKRKRQGTEGKDEN